MSIFENLSQIDVSEYTERKDGLTYLSWPYAWAEIKRRYPDATYDVHLFGEKKLPYVYDENTGYMVFTDVTVSGLTHNMWLPVMNGANKAMRTESYTYDTKYKKSIEVEAATMFDINKTIMRCLVKNLAMFGLGLYIYAGEDLPQQRYSCENCGAEFKSCVYNGKKYSAEQAYHMAKKKSLDKKVRCKRCREEMSLSQEKPVEKCDGESE